MVIRPRVGTISTGDGYGHCCITVGPVTRTAGAVRENVYRGRPGLPGCQNQHMEQPARQRDICPVSVNLSSAFKNISVPGLVP